MSFNFNDKIMQTFRLQMCEVNRVFRLLNYVAGPIQYAKVLISKVCK